MTCKEVSDCNVRLLFKTFPVGKFEPFIIIHMHHFLICNFFLYCTPSSGTRFLSLTWKFTLIWSTCSPPYTDRFTSNLYFSSFLWIFSDTFSSFFLYLILIFVFTNLLCFSFWFFQAWFHFHLNLNMCSSVGYWMAWDYIKRWYPPSSDIMV